MYRFLILESLNNLRKNLMLASQPERPFLSPRFFRRDYKSKEPHGYICGVDHFVDNSISILVVWWCKVHIFCGHLENKIRALRSFDACLNFGKLEFIENICFVGNLRCWRYGSIFNHKILYFKLYYICLLTFWSY